MSDPKRCTECGHKFVDGDCDCIIEFVVEKLNIERKKNKWLERKLEIIADIAQDE